jgi:uncharacterized membrane protein YecN with MAPEG domain
VTPLPIASLITGFFALMMVVLSFQVSVRRVKSGTTFGHGEDPVLRRRIRAHGNFIEYAPLAIAVIALLEYGSAPHFLVLTVAIILAAVRVLHAFGMLYVENPAPRATAMIAQHLTLLASAVWLIANALSMT